MDSLASGTLLARRYRLLDRIGVGGMSVIWRAHDEMLERSVAVKVLASELAADSRFRDLVRAEARAAAALVHPHVTATYDYGETVNADGEVTAFVVMELLEGEPLSARLTAGPLPWPEALRVCAEVAEALAAAHRHGIVHRDITSDNVMLTSDGVKVLDFGIATTVGAPDDDADGLSFGTPAYVAPERLDGRRARPANDTYALGVLLFETLTGNPPYPAETWEELAATCHDNPPYPEVAGLPPPVAQLCRQCLAVDPQRRPTAHQVGWTLRRHLPGAGRRAIHRLGARRALAAAGAAASLALGVVLGASLMGTGTQPTGKEAAPSHDAGTSPASDTEQPRTRGEVPMPGADLLPPVPGGAAPDLPDSSAAGPEVDDSADDGAGPDGSLAGATSTEVTLDTVAQLVADGHAQGDIRGDVAQDLQGLIESRQLDIDNGSTDPSAAAAELQRQVQVWADQDGAITSARADELHTALDQFASHS